MLGKLKNIYREMKKSYLGDKAALVPEKYWSQFVCLGRSSDVHYQYSMIVPKDKKKVLIVGVHGGRDYFYFKANGYDVVGEDLFPDPQFGEMIVGNIEDVKLPEKEFDVVVASAVVEHLANDFIGLKNIRRTLKDDGLFLACIPNYNDWEDTHIHIYSEKSSKRLLEAAGFKIRRKFSYPNLFIYPPVFNFINHAVSALNYIFFKKTAYQHTLPLFWKLEFFLSERHSSLYGLWRTIIGSFYNGTESFFLCEKGESLDQLAFNREKFETKTH